MKKTRNLYRTLTFLIVISCFPLVSKAQQAISDSWAATDALGRKLRPETVRLGENCRAMLLNLKMRKDVELKSVTLETLSQEVVVGLMGITIMK